MALSINGAKNGAIPDIQRDIEQADIVIAEITPGNANVFYELGYDWVVFFNESMGGKVEVERNLRKHLDAIAGR